MDGNNRIEHWFRFEGEETKTRIKFLVVCVYLQFVQCRSM